MSTSSLVRRTKPVKFPSETLFTALQLKQIGDWLLNGFNDEDIAFFFKCSVAQILKVRRGETYKEVRAFHLKRKHELITKIRDCKLRRWQSLAWFLERRYPQEWAKPEIQLTLGGSTITNNTLVVTAESASELASRAKPVNQLIDKLIDSRQGNVPKEALDVSAKLVK